MLQNVAHLLHLTPALGDFHNHSTLTSTGCPIEWTFDGATGQVSHTLDIHPRQVPPALQTLTRDLQYCWLQVEGDGEKLQHTLLRPHAWNDPDPLLGKGCIPVLSMYRCPECPPAVRYVHRHADAQLLQHLLQKPFGFHLPAFWNDLRVLTQQPLKSLPGPCRIQLDLDRDRLTLHLQVRDLFPDEPLARLRLESWFACPSYQETMQHSGLQHTRISWTFTPERLSRAVSVTLRHWH